MIEPITFGERLRRRAERHSERRAITFLADDGSEASSLGYGALARCARGIGALLQRRGVAGGRALLLYPPCIDFVTAFFGCLSSGTVAVPTFPPDPARLERTLPRLLAIAADARPSCVLTTGALLARAGSLLRAHPALRSLPWIATDEVGEEPAPSLREPHLGPESLAMLQYTSGSTAAPRGVMVSHGNLVQNAALLERSWALEERMTTVSWLPLYHDMGLIGGVLQPVYSGIHCVLMAPHAFLLRPALWLETITRYRADVSGGPNFAYELCVRKVTQRASLDLTSWSIAFNGAEPVRASTLAAFAAAFSGCGFRPRAMLPCYGLAEATLYVCGAAPDEPPRRLTVAAEALQRGEVCGVPEGSPGARTLVGCGAPDGVEVRVVDAGDQTPCPAGRVGEVWIAGPTVAQGYFDRPEETAATFGARLRGQDETAYLRTGDLGALHDGQLYITGRCKDLIIISGRNHYPQDIEQTVTAASPALRPGGCAAFSIARDDDEHDQGERLIIAAEVDERVARGGLDELLKVVRGAVMAEHGVRVEALVLLRRGTVPKTSSGKIQRHACRDAFLAGTLVRAKEEA